MSRSDLHIKTQKPITATSATCPSEFLSFEELRDLDVCPELLQIFRDWTEELEEEPDTYITFDKSDVDDWFESYGEGYTRKEFDLHVHSLVLYYGWYNKAKHGFKVTNIPVR